MEDSAIDLSLRPRTEEIKIFRPTPRPPWSILWYQNLWTTFARPPEPHPLSESTQNNEESKKEEGVRRDGGTAIVDVACCDGPVRFERVSNPNFSLTVEHASPGTEDVEEKREGKTYLCIYCNQTFKSLFCYQKHKKRHLNPVSVDITQPGCPNLSAGSESRKATKDLNVQFFPCKKCGSKFPSYYFVHKHKKTCQ